MRLEGKVAFISGGARGMGATEAQIFAREGAKVAIGDVLEECSLVAQEIIDAGGDCYFVHLDVTSESEWQAAINRTVAEYGRLDILVNNAGVSQWGLVHETSEADWDHVMDINAKGVFLGTKFAIPAMIDSGGGSIINISSQLGIVGTEMSSAQYQASKGAVRLLTKTTAMQYAEHGIRCNSVHPGPINTPMTQVRRGDRGNYEQMISRIPMARYGEPEEIANGVLYLASDESGWMTGSELVLDGGWTAQ
ncbi:MAG: glucose 1-dehydrogenase [Dehalococcoidia bacterium]|nr:glucose 1-dehydrogenase [Dehalococcoidia bacterium]